MVEKRNRTLFGGAEPVSIAGRPQSATRSRFARVYSKRFSMSDRRAVALVLLSAAGFGSSAVFAKAAYASGVNPSTMLALRFVIAAMLLLPLV